MQTIDPATLVIVVMLLAVFLAAIMLNMRTSFPRTIGGIGQWAAATVLVVVCAVLFAWQDSPRFFHVSLANGLMTLAMIYMASGLLRMYRLRLPPKRFVVSGFSAITLLMAWYTYVQPSFQARLVIMSLLGAGMFGYLTWLPLRHGQRSLGSLITAFAFGVVTLSCLLRLTSVLIQIDNPTGLLDLGKIQIIYLATFNITLLIATVGFILMANERLREILEFSAAHDALTGALNRDAFFKRAHIEFERSRRHSRPLSIALMDLDHFKQINDNYGHTVGDQVLAEFCRSVRAVLRPGDVLGRYGGEEFVLLLPGTAREAADTIAQRVLTAIQTSPNLPPHTVSIGFASLAPDTSDIDELLIAADKALYFAKQNGRNRAEEWRAQETDARQA